MPQSKFGGPGINSETPVSASIAFYIDGEDAWIIGVKEGGNLKMVKLRVTGLTTFDWISSKYRPDGSYPESCLTSFSASCFVGTDTNEESYQIILVAASGKFDKKVRTRVKFTLEYYAHIIFS